MAAGGPYAEQSNESKGKKCSLEDGRLLIDMLAACQPPHNVKQCDKKSWKDKWYKALASLSETNTPAGKCLCLTLPTFDCGSGRLWGDGASSGGWKFNMWNDKAKIQGLLFLKIFTNEDKHKYSLFKKKIEYNFG